ncbi:conserved hypothetical protein [Pirellula staleyi DSM 6068]|uniref:MazG nucleotide pyrophosphohydrolase n=1 Tax=Pirellula staleyi (strain ATCC 27377 / DSM 6068 / ICPB 4128) TaxID=530564 RepID=D2QY35_PIRSD|nr:nucleotide pyrophosphohydrolase [Pirellula staleyi]ADB16249.1 conserved hypothetical protein [Pirellula staleyi DSM 6068]
MHDQATTIAELRALVQRFVDERDWRQFHTAKNLAMSIAIEAAELMEHFQWLDQQASQAIAQQEVKKAVVAEELADVLSYVLAISSALEIDLASSLEAKMVKNALKYPADQIRGRYGHDDERAS